MDGKQCNARTDYHPLPADLNHFRRGCHFPVAIEMMSRFRTSSQQRKIAQAAAQAVLIFS